LEVVTNVLKEFIASIFGIEVEVEVSEECVTFIATSVLKMEAIHSSTALVVTRFHGISRRTLAINTAV
jgi:hypothetical protein